MSARWIQGEPRMALGFPVLTAQGIESFDMVGLSSGNVVRAADETWASAVSTPSAPTVADGGVAVGSPLTNAATGVKISYQFPWGEGALSNAGSVTPTATALIKFTPVALPDSSITGINVYVETAAGSGTYKLWKTVSTASIQFIDAYGTGRVPPTAVATGAKELTQYSFANRFLGVSNQRKIAGKAYIFGNSLGNGSTIKIMVIRGPGAVIEFDCSSASFAVGDPVGAAKDTGNALLNQTVVAVAHPSLAIGRVVEAGTSVTKVKVELLSRYTSDLT